MAFIDYDLFVQNDASGYLVIDGMEGSRLNLTKAPNQLKIEADEIKVIADIIRGINPSDWIAGTYREGEYVMYNNLIYRSNIDANSDEPALNWTVQHINNIVGTQLTGENI